MKLNDRTLVRGAFRDVVEQKVIEWLDKAQQAEQAKANEMFAVVERVWAFREIAWSWIGIEALLGQTWVITENKKHEENDDGELGVVIRRSMEFTATYEAEIGVDSLECELVRFHCVGKMWEDGDLGCRMVVHDFDTVLTVIGGEDVGHWISS